MALLKFEPHGAFEEFKNFTKALAELKGQMERVEFEAKGKPQLAESAYIAMVSRAGLEPSGVSEARK